MCKARLLYVFIRYALSQETRNQNNIRVLGNNWIAFMALTLDFSICVEFC